MFDIGFWEVILVGIVALLVVGPDKLPGLARTAGLWVGRARRMVASVRAEIDKELKSEELRQVMARQAQSTGLHEIIEETRSVIDEVATPPPPSDSGRNSTTAIQADKPTDGAKD